LDHLIRTINETVQAANKDNISRTIQYEKFYKRNKEIRWAFLASMVSRNAGWCMCDLKGSLLSRVINDELREEMFLTYEKANWLIFSDAFPQLMIYEASKTVRKPLFQLLRHFSVSSFMVHEWNHYWLHNDGQRLLYALIINEQHVIQKPVIENSRFKKRVFNSIPYTFQDLFHFNAVLFPTLEGKLYGCSVHDFIKVKNRIELGKKLATILFHPLLEHKFLQFSKKTEPTGSRRDYEQYSRFHSDVLTPFLRMTYPVIHHPVEVLQDWYDGQAKKFFFRHPKRVKKIDLTDWYHHKQKQLKVAVSIEELITLK
jgi:hypothetical protein